MENNNQNEEVKDTNDAEYVWIYENSSSVALGDRCYTCGIEQDFPAVYGIYSLHTRDCEYAPESKWVDGRLQAKIDDQRNTELRREASRIRYVEKERERTDFNNENPNLLSTPLSDEARANQQALDLFGVSFSNLMANFDSELAKTEIARWEDWLAKHPIRTETESYWIEFLEDYAGKIKSKLGE